MAFTIRPREMEVGKYYEIADVPDAPSWVQIELVEGGRWPVARLREDRRNAAGAIVVPKGTRFDLDPFQWLGRPGHPIGKPTTRYAPAALFARPVPLATAKLGERYTMLPPGAPREPSKAFFGTLLEVDKGPPVMQLPIWRVRVRVDPEYKELWGLETPELEWKTRPETMELFAIPERKTAIGKVAEDKSLPPDVEAALRRYGGRRKTRKSRRRQTRRRK